MLEVSTQLFHHCFPSLGAMMDCLFWENSAHDRFKDIWKINAKMRSVLAVDEERKFCRTIWKLKSKVGNALFVWDKPLTSFQNVFNRNHWNSWMSSSNTKLSSILSRFHAKILNNLEQLLKVLVCRYQSLSVQRF